MKTYKIVSIHNSLYTALEKHGILACYYDVPDAQLKRFADFAEIFVERCYVVRAEDNTLKFYVLCKEHIFGFRFMFLFSPKRRNTTMEPFTVVAINRETLTITDTLIDKTEAGRKFIKDKGYIVI